MKDRSNAHRARPTPRELVKPFVTIAIPTRNRAGTHLTSALHAALSQTVENIEILIGDNASTDHTESTMACVTDARVQYIRHDKDIGANSNFNYLLKIAKGEWFLLLHDDDLIDADFIESCLNALQGNRNCGFIRTGVRIVDGEGHAFKSTPNELLGPTHADFFRSWCKGRTAIYLCNTLYHTERLRQVGGFVSLHNLLEDNYALVKLLECWDHANVQEVKASYRFTLNQRSYQVPVVEWCQDFLKLLEMIVSTCERHEQASIRTECLKFFDHICVKHANGVAPLRRRIFARMQVARYFGVQSLRRPWRPPFGRRPSATEQ